MAESQFTKRKFKLFLIILILVAAISVAAGAGLHFYIGRYVEADGIADSLSESMKLGSSFTVDDVIESENYPYGWMKSQVSVSVLAKTSAPAAKSEDGAEEYSPTQELLEYDPETRTFTVCGAGNGIIEFNNPLDSSVTFQVPFTTKFASEDTALILEQNYPEFFADGIVGKGEIAAVEEVSLTAPRLYDVGEFALFSNFRRVLLPSEDLLEPIGLEKFEDGVIFYVSDGLYGGYISSECWAEYAERVFPIVDLSEGVHALVFEFMGGNMPSAGADAVRYFYSVADGATLNISEFAVERTGYTFSGWYTSNDGGATLTDTRIDENYSFGADTKLYAKWAANQYEIIYNDEYVSDLPANEKLTYDVQGKISAMVLERTGYTFMGWSLAEGSSAVDFAAGQSVLNLTAENGAKINLYAVWAANSYTIIYNGNGAAVYGVPSAQKDIAFDTEVTLSDAIPVWKGYTFIGWSLDENAVTAEYQPGQTLKNLVSDTDGRVTLYAVWSANSYTIKYDANGGMNAPSDQTGLKYGEDVQLSSKIPVRTGCVFLGWDTQKNATSASYSAGGTAQNLVSDVNGEVVLYAVWKYDTFRISYNSNGGSGAPSTSTNISYNQSGFAVSSGVPVRTGYQFLGWALTSSATAVDFIGGQTLSASDINSLYLDALSSQKICTLYAVWDKLYKITIKTDGATVSGVTDGAYYNDGTVLNITVSYDHGDNRSLTIDGVSYDGSTSARFTMPAHNVTIEAGSSSCFAKGSLITMADGSLKKIENISVGDEVLVFNHQTGKVDSSPVAYVFSGGYGNYKILTLHFSNGAKVDVISEHVFFNYDLKKYVPISAENAGEYIGDNFCYLSGEQSQIAAARLVSYEIREEYTESYSLVTAYQLNHFVNGMLIISDDIDGLYNIFELDDSLRYDAEKMQADIEKYGLYSYEDWSQYLTYEQFLTYSVAYLKVSVGKGLITEEQIICLIEKYL